MTEKTQITSRLNSLREEYAKGELMLSQLDTEATELRSRLLRIAGAVQVLEELLGEEAPEQSDDL